MDTINEYEEFNRLRSQPMLSDADLRRFVENGELRIEPTPQRYGPISIDLSIGALYEVEEHFKYTVDLYDAGHLVGTEELGFIPFMKRSDLPRRVRESPKGDNILWVIYTRFPDGGEGYGNLLHIREKQPNYNDGWLLERHRRYIIEPRERIWWNSQFEPELSMRSRYARSFLDVDGSAYAKNGGKLFIHILSWGNTIVYPEDRITQLHFRHMSRPSSPQVRSFGRWQDYIKQPSISFAERKAALVPLDDTALVFKGDVIDRKNLKAGSFERIDLFGDSIPPNSLILAKTSTIVEVPNRRAVNINEGLLVGDGNGNLALSYGPTMDFHLHVHPSAPYSQPGSRNRLVLEIPFPVDAPDYFRELRSLGVPLIALEGVNLTSPATPYSGIFKTQKDILLPF